MVEFALGTDRAAVRQHNMFGNGQPQSGSAGLAGPGFIYPVKTFEEPAEVLGSNARTEIADKEFHAVSAFAGSHFQLASAGSGTNLLIGPLRIGGIVPRTLDACAIATTRVRGPSKRR